MMIVRVHLEDTGEYLEAEFASWYAARQYLEATNLFYILGANSMEGRETTTYWKSKDAMEAYRLERLNNV
jgi:hypothetical protein